MLRMPSGLSVPTDVVANDASADGRGAEARYGEAGLRGRRRLADLGVASTRTPLRYLSSSSSGMTDSVTAASRLAPKLSPG